MDGIEKTEGPVSIEGSGQARYPGLRVGLAYLSAVVLPPGVLLVRSRVDWQTTSPGMIQFLAPILLAAYLGGLGPGLVATAFSALLASYFLLPPFHSLSIANGFQSINWIALVAEGTMTSILLASMHRKLNGYGYLPTSSRFSLERKVQIAFAFALACLSCIGIISFKSVVQSQNNLVWVGHTHEVIATLNHVLSTATDAETGIRGFVITGNEEFLQPYNLSAPALKDDLARLRSLTADNSSQQIRLDALEQIAGRRMTSLQEELQSRRTGGLSMAGAALAAEQGKRLHDDLRRTVEEMEAVERDLLVQREDAARSQEAFTKTVLVTGSGLALCVVLVAAFLIGRDFAGARSARASLLQANRELESRVQQRTEELQQSNRDLSENEARLAGIISSATDAIITIDQEQRITLFNPGAEKMFRCPAGEALHQPLDRFVPQRYRLKHRDHIKHYETTGKSRRNMSGLESLSARRANGEEFPAEISISKTAFAGQMIFTAIVRDITERQQADELLRRSRDRLSLALEVANVGTYDRDIAKNQMEWSAGALATMGLAPETTLTYDQYLERLHPDDRDKMEMARKDAWENNRDFEVELRTIWPDGSLHWLVVRGRPYWDDSGRPLHSSGVVQDITRQKRAEEAQLRTQKLQSLGTLAGGIAHDFNNILLCIFGNAELALQDLPQDHPVQMSLGEINKAGRRATDLVRQILTFSRPQEQKREIRQMTTVLAETVKLIRSTLPAMIEIQTVVAQNLPPVSIDSSQIQQVIVNLATNSAHAIGSRAGVIEMQLTETDLCLEDSSGYGIPPGRYVVLAVKDDGCGMDRQTIQRIFDPFFTTKKLGEGTGLGLSVVDGIVRGHGGAIRLYSDPGKGTVFHVFLPVAREMQKPESKPVGDVSNGRNCRILYVDDEESLVSLITRKLTRMGYQVTGFTDPEAALKAFSSEPQKFDAIVSDLAMPHLSGFELLRRALKVRPDLPTILTSGYIRTQDHELAHELGIGQLILKPNTMDELGLALDSLLRAASK